MVGYDAQIMRQNRRCLYLLYAISDNGPVLRLFSGVGKQKINSQACYYQQVPHKINIVRPVILVP